MVEAIVFIDSGFLSKLSKYLGAGKHLVYNIISLSDNIAKKQGMECKKIFYYTAPPFQSNNPTEDERKRKDKYDTFIKKLSQNRKIIIREGRCQRLIDRSGIAKFSQKAVDTLMVIDIMTLPIDYKEIKKIILIACDSDFVPVIEKLKDFKIDTLLYTYFTKRRNTNFSRSTHLMNIVSKYIKLSKEDFDNCPLNKKEV